MTDNQPRPEPSEAATAADNAARRVILAVIIVATAVAAGLILSRGRFGPRVAGTSAGDRQVTMATGARVTIPKGYEGRYVGFLNEERTVEAAYFCPVGTPRFEG